MMRKVLITKPRASRWLTSSADEDGNQRPSEAIRGHQIRALTHVERRPQLIVAIGRRRAEPPSRLFEGCLCSAQQLVSLGRLSCELLDTARGR